MRMIITNIECKDKRIYVTGETGIGSIKGKWCYRDFPIIGAIYFFELSIDELDKNEISVIYDERFCTNVNLCDNQVQFQGICEEVDDVYIIRFSDDWIEMISIEDDDFSIKKGDKISFSLNYECIEIYPY